MAAPTPSRGKATGPSPAPATTPESSGARDDADAVVFEGTPENDDAPPVAAGFGSPDSTAGGARVSESPETNGDECAVVAPSETIVSPHRTQGEPGHVAKVVDWVENDLVPPARSPGSPGGDASAKMASKKRRGVSGVAASVAGGFASATSGALQRMRAARNAPETPVAARKPAVRRSLVDADRAHQEEELAMARRMSPLSLDDDDDDDRPRRSPASPLEPEPDASPAIAVAVDHYDFDAFVESEARERAEREASLARRMSPLSAVWAAGDEGSPAAGESPATAASPETLADAFASDDKENTGASRESRGVTFAATPDEVRVDVVETEREKDAGYAAAVVARRTPNAHGALFASALGSPGAAHPSPLAPTQPGAAPALRERSANVVVVDADGGATKKPTASFAGETPVFSSFDSDLSASAQRRVMRTPLPISKSVLERIDALGPEMQPMQKYILLMGIALDFYAKTQLVRELRRFATQGSGVGWAWFSMVFIFFLLSGSCTCAYWLLHYPMPSEAEMRAMRDAGSQQTKVFGFTKLDFKKMVRNLGAICAMCQLGTAFAAWRALRTNDLRQRKAEMDLRGMQLVDTVFLILPVATLQAYVGMACSSPDAYCRGRSGFDVLLFLAVFGAITSATLCFVSLDLHEKPPNMTWREYWRAHKAHLSEMAAKTAFRFLELSARISLVALFAAARGGWVFFVLFMHAFLVLVGLKYWPKIVTGGVPDRDVWAKICRTKEVKLFGGRVFKLPLLDDSKLLAATMIWPPSMFVANATDKHGEFWWRSKSCPRKSFLSVDRHDAVFPMPLFVTLQVFEAMLMLLIVGAVLNEYPHYRAYFLIVVLINVAWLTAALSWVSAAAVWNPFLPEGPPLGFKRGERGSGAPGTAGRSETAKDRRDETGALGATKGSAARGRDPAVAKSMGATGIFSPCASDRGRTPGKSAASGGRHAHGGGGRHAHGGVARSLAVAGARAFARPLDRGGEGGPSPKPSPSAAEAATTSASATTTRDPAGGGGAPATRALATDFAAAANRQSGATATDATATLESSADSEPARARRPPASPAPATVAATVAATVTATVTAPPPPDGGRAREPLRAPEQPFAPDALPPRAGGVSPLPAEASRGTRRDSAGPRRESGGLFGRPGVLTDSRRTSAEDVPNARAHESYAYRYGGDGGEADEAD